jgi:uncharacterized protein YfbU (UPF0304 family)
MELSKIERLQLINQFLILEKLYPEEASYYEQHRIALEQGFALHYRWIVENVWDDLSESECRKVLDSLELYRAIQHSYQTLNDKGDLTDTKVRFPGFDGNNESHHLAYAKYFVMDLGRYDELVKGQAYPDFNSHCPMLEKYVRMHHAWTDIGKPLEMSVENIQYLLDK